MFHTAMGDLCHNIGIYIYVYYISGPITTKCLVQHQPILWVSIFEYNIE